MTTRPCIGCPFRRARPSPPALADVIYLPEPRTT